MSILEGKVAIVTGGGRGIGRGHCLHLAQGGAAVLVNDVDRDAAHAVADEIRTGGGRAVACDASVAARDSANQVIKAATDAFGVLDILVNNAGNLRDRSFLKMSDDEFDSVWLVHVKGTFWCAQAAALHMRERGDGGVIINTTSGAHFGSFGQTNYAAAKGAIASMTYTWALELARYGIRVNAVGPTGTTRMSETFKTSEASNAAGGAFGMPYIDPGSNGPLIVFLCSAYAQGVSGQVFGCGGERVAHMVQPHYGKTLVRPGGWSVESIASNFAGLQAEFGALGMLGRPYPFHAGIKAPNSEQAVSTPDA